MRPTKRGHTLTPRSEKGLQLAEKAKAHHAVGLIYTVESASGNGSRYGVSLDPVFCSCPDWTYRGKERGVECKHIIAAALQHVGC